MLATLCLSGDRFGRILRFEDHNGRLLKMFNGTQEVALQIAKRFRLGQHLKALSTCVTQTNDESLFEVQKKLLGSYIPSKKIHFFNEDIALIGKAKKRLLSVEEASVLPATIDPNEIFVFEKFLFNDNLYTIKAYKEGKIRRQNCYVLLSNGNVCEIVTCAKCVEVTNTSILLFVRLMEVQDLTSSAPFKKQFVKVISASPTLSVFRPHDLVSKCVLLQKEPIMYFSVLPNLLDRD